MDIDPLSQTFVAAWWILFGVRCFLTFPIFLLSLVLCQVNILPLSRRRSDLFWHLASIWHHRVMRHCNPLVSDHVGCVLVAEKGWHLHPGSGIPGASRFWVAASINVATANQGYGLPVSDAHPSKDVTDVLSEVLPALQSAFLINLHARCQAVLSPGQPARSDRPFFRCVHAPTSESNPWTICVLEGDVGSQDPKVCMRDPRMLGLHRLE
mmetsp:Transcript_126942/g.179092  ORF Transcript_126942/g.179092 Transcript_126942/m.179092 type:complete len:210 (-) Transcript_126942:490-1119(-)